MARTERPRYAEAVNTLGMPSQRKGRKLDGAERPFNKKITITV